LTGAFEARDDLSPYRCRRFALRGEAAGLRIILQPSPLIGEQGGLLLAIDSRQCLVPGAPALICDRHQTRVAADHEFGGHRRFCAIEGAGVAAACYQEKNDRDAYSQAPIKSFLRTASRSAVERPRRTECGR